MYPMLPGYGMPVASAPPGFPYSVAPAPLPPKGVSKVTVVVLAIALGLFVLVGGALGTLFYQESQDSSRKAEQIAQLQEENRGLRRQLTDTQDDLTDTDEELSEVTEQRDAFAGCINAIYDMWLAFDIDAGGGTVDVEGAVREMSRRCAEADRYLFQL